MGRHTRPEPEDAADATADGHRRIAMAIRHTIPAPTPAGPTPGLDATTLSIRPVAPAARLATAPAADAVVITPPVPAAGPPSRLSWSARRTARREQEAKAALAAQLSRAQRRSRQVAAFASVPTPRSPAGLEAPVDAARPPWTAH
ncbi:hypothetical protein ACR9E3_16455 [Actinomycetospora sp. C-140]